MAKKKKDYLCFEALLETPSKWDEGTLYAILNEDGLTVTCYIVSKTGLPKKIGTVTTVDFKNLNLNANKHSIARINGNLVQETVTSLEDLELTGETLSITFNDEGGVQNTLTVNLSSLKTEPVNLIEGPNIVITGTYPNLTISSSVVPGGQVDQVKAGAGISVDSTDPTAPQVSLNVASQNSLLLADTAVQPGDNTEVLTNTGEDGTSRYVEQKELGAVAFSNDYNDLDNTPPPAERYKSTSTTSNPIISVGDQTYYVTPGMSYEWNQIVLITHNTNNFMNGIIKSYNAATGEMLIEIRSGYGTGTYSSWKIDISGDSFSVKNLQKTLTASYTLRAIDSGHTIFLNGTNITITFNPNLHTYPPNFEVFFYNQNATDADFVFVAKAGWTYDYEALTLAEKARCAMLRVENTDKLILAGNE